MMQLAYEGDLTEVNGENQVRPPRAVACGLRERVHAKILRERGMPDGQPDSLEELDDAVPVSCLQVSDPDRQLAAERQIHRDRLSVGQGEVRRGLEHGTERVSQIGRPLQASILVEILLEIFEETHGR